MPASSGTGARGGLVSMRHLAIATFVLATSSGAAAAGPSAEIRCDYASRIDCSASGCKPTPVGSGYLLAADVETLVATTARATSAATLPAIKVCDASGCTPIAVRAARSGAFVNIAQDGGAHFVKVAVADIASVTGRGPGVRKGDFVEVSARFLSTVTYAGRCAALVR